MGPQSLDDYTSRHFTEHGEDTLEGTFEGTKICGKIFAFHENDKKCRLEICDWRCGVWSWLGCEWGLSWACCLESCGTAHLGSTVALWILGWWDDLDG